MRLQGRREFPLTEHGREQAEALAKRLSDQGVAAVYTSPIRRAADTAAAIAAGLGLAAQAEPRVQEYDFGEALSGLTWPEIQEKRPELVQALLTNAEQFPQYPGEEGREKFRQRVTEAMTEIAERHQTDAAAAVVTHAGPIVVFLLETLGRAYRRPIPFAVDNASVTTVEFNAQTLPGFPRAIVVGINDTCHLRRD